MDGVRFRLTRASLVVNNTSLRVNPDAPDGVILLGLMKQMIFRELVFSYRVKSLREASVPSVDRVQRQPPGSNAKTAVACRQKA